MALLGNNIYITTVENNTPTIIAGTRSNEIQSGAELIEISGPNSGKWRQYIAGRKEWSFTTNFLVLANSNVQDLLKTGTAVNIYVVGRYGNNTVNILSGSAIIKTAKMTFTIGDIANGSFQFVGNGELQDVYVPPEPPSPAELHLRVTGENTNEYLMTNNLMRTI